MTLDDLQLEDGKVAPFSRSETGYAAMGRYGNVFLTSGEPDLRLEARAGEVVRLWLTNTANTRVFNVTLPGARMKLISGDSGRVEREEPVAPSRPQEFEVLRRAPELEAERQRLDAWLAAQPDKVLALVAQTDDPTVLPEGAGLVVYACPMHPEISGQEPGRCPSAA